MAKTKFETEVKTEKKDFWQKWSLQGNEEEIAKNLGVNYNTLQKVKADLKSPRQRRSNKR